MLLCTHLRKEKASHLIGNSIFNLTKLQKENLILNEKLSYLCIYIFDAASKTKA